MIYVTDVLIYFASLLTYACFLTLFVPAYLLISLSASASPYKRLWLNRVAWTTTRSRAATGRTTSLTTWTGMPDRAATRTRPLPHPAPPPPRSYTKKPYPGNPKSGTEAVYQSKFYHYMYLYLNSVKSFRFLGANFLWIIISSKVLLMQHHGFICILNEDCF